MDEMEIDRYTPAELKALDLRTQCDLLNELVVEQGRLGRLTAEALDLLAAARISALKSPMTETKAAVIRAKVSVDKLAIASRTRKQQASILQSLVRMPAA